ncbi:MAG: cupin domain-containing protein [Acetobacteraceae bacterium]|nr:cupin domain-containing protein [Acetobacteraceae bacterium]
MPVEISSRLRVSPEDVRDRPNDMGHPSVRALSHGSMEVRWFCPEPGVQHKPHDRDEVYFVVSGTANFRRGNDAGPFEEAAVSVFGHEIVPVKPGDVLFVPAGAHHDFDATSPDFAVWALFYGPEGGERG